MKFILILTLFVLAGCYHAQQINLITGADHIKVFRKSDPPASCSEIRPFTITSGAGCGNLGQPGNFGAAYNLFRNTIVEMGGNAGLIQYENPPHMEPGCYVNAYVINGVAYKCPDDAFSGK